jgi:hypothetical protein
MKDIPIREPFDDDAGETAQQHRDGDREHDDPDERRSVNLTRYAQERQDREREERSKRVDVAVREVDEFDDPVDHRVAQRDERVDAAE